MTRYLKESEIEYILDFIKPNPCIPKLSAESIVNINKKKLRKQLKQNKIYPKLINKLKKEIEKKYFSSLISPGTSVGIISAQSIGEKNTQLTLNSFHKCGQGEKTVTTGVPRFQELLNATKAPKNINSKIYLKEKFDNVKDIRKLIGDKLICFRLKDLSSETNICIGKKPEEWYENFKLLYNNDFEKYEDCISIKLNIKKMFDYKIKIKKIADVIGNNYDDLSCIFSPLHIGQIDIFVDMEKIKFTEKQLLYVTEDNYKEIYLEECVLPILEQIIISGIEGIDSIYYTNEKEEWFIETDGTNFEELLKIDFIDKNRLISNNVWDIYNILGIEAAREFLIEEFKSIMGDVNDCHVKLLVNRMTYSGTISSISRYTLRKNESGPMGKSSFEETLDHYVNAAISGDIEKTRGVSASIICGKRAKIGTGMMDLKIDINKLPKIKI